VITAVPKELSLGFTRCTRMGSAFLAPARLVRRVSPSISQRKVRNASPRLGDSALMREARPNKRIEHKVCLNLIKIDHVARRWPNSVVVLRRGIPSGLAASNEGYSCFRSATKFCPTAVGPIRFMRRTSDASRLARGMSSCHGRAGRRRCVSLPRLGLVRIDHSCRPNAG